MKKSISRTIGSGGDKYDLTITFDGMEVEQLQEDAVSFYAWKVQRSIRGADEDAKADMRANGIHLHATEVGKPVVSTEKLVNTMSDEQAERALEMLKERLAK